MHRLPSQDRRVCIPLGHVGHMLARVYHIHMFGFRVYRPNNIVQERVQERICTGGRTYRWVYRRSVHTGGNNCHIEWCCSEQCRGLPSSCSQSQVHSRGLIDVGHRQSGSLCQDGEVAQPAAISANTVS